MASTSKPTNIATPSWQNGAAEGTTLGSGITRRVRANIDDVSARDVNELRSSIEGLMSHVHDYTDNVGGC